MDGVLKKMQGFDFTKFKEELGKRGFRMLQREEDNYPLEKMTDTGMTELLMPLENISLEDQLANIGASFHDKLFELIDEAHLDNKDVWKRANLDRKHFSKIQCDQNYHPKKKTCLLYTSTGQTDRSISAAGRSHQNSRDGQR